MGADGEQLQVAGLHVARVARHRHAPPLGPASALSARRRNVATVATLGIGPDECLKPTYGGCSDPCARHAAPGAGRCSTAKLTPARLRRSRWERDDTLADEEVNGGSLGTLGGFDNQRQG